MTTGVADEDAQALSEMMQVLASKRNEGQAALAGADRPRPRAARPRPRRLRPLRGVRGGDRPAAARPRPVRHALPASARRGRSRAGPRPAASSPTTNEGRMTMRCAFSVSRLLLQRRRDLLGATGASARGSRLGASSSRARRRWRPRAGELREETGLDGHLPAAGSASTAPRPASSATRSTRQATRPRLELRVRRRRPVPRRSPPATSSTRVRWVAAGEEVALAPQRARARRDLRACRPGRERAQGAARREAPLEVGHVPRSTRGRFARSLLFADHHAGRRRRARAAPRRGREGGRAPRRSRPPKAA